MTNYAKNNRVGWNIKLWMALAQKLPIHWTSELDASFNNNDGPFYFETWRNPNHLTTHVRVRYRGVILEDITTDFPSSELIGKLELLYDTRR